ncbi:MAG: hypothetical protein ACR2ND_14430 [Solirubrobacteraceae bacterium]
MESIPLLDRAGQRRSPALVGRSLAASLVAALLVVCCGAVTARAAALGVTLRSTISGPAGLTGTCSARAGVNNPLVVADPRNPRRLVATYLLGSNGAGVGAVAALSRDAGRTWRRVALHGMTKCEGGRADIVSDPYLAYGGGEHVYIDESGIGLGSNSSADNVFLAASADGGASFRRAIEPFSGRPSQRAPLSPAPAHRGLVTVQYESFDPSSALGSTPWTLGLAGSPDGGVRFAAPTAFETTPRGTVAVAVGLLRSRAALVAVSADISLAESGAYERGVPTSTLTEHVMARRSYDGGARFGPPSRVGNLAMRLNDPGGCCLISSAQAPDGTLYATWTALSGLSGGEVLLFRSRDRGATWRRLRVARTTTRAFESSVAVAPGGRVGVLWLQGAPGAGGAAGATDVVAHLASSPDRGGTWARLRLAGPFRPGEGVNLNEGGSLGEYQGITGLPGGFGVALTTTGRASASRGATVVRYLRVAS